MKIILSPQRRDDTLDIIKSGDILSLNGEYFDLSPIGEGDTLPADAISSLWFLDKVERINGELVLTLLFPNPWNYSPAQAFPVPLENVPDGPVVFPGPLPDPLPPAPIEVSKALGVTENPTGDSFEIPIAKVLQGDFEA